MKKITFLFSSAFIILLFCNASAQSQSKKIKVDFTYSLSCIDTTVRFMPHINNSKLYYWWDFGDNQYSNMQKPQHKFSNPGKYKVKLFIEDPKAYPDTVSGKTEKIISIVPCKNTF